jgi:glycosidase
LGAARFWIDEFDIDGLRLDAADVLSQSFMEDLSRCVKARKSDFWLVGEVVHGDYRHWAREGCLDSVTNYELYKGLWSSFNDKNFYEIAWTLNRQYGEEGMYAQVALYNFADNHDVNRVASVLKNPAHLFPLYGLLCTVPGVPSIYYGSEYGLRGERGAYSDHALRPAWRDDGRYDEENAPAVDSASLFAAIKRLLGIRRDLSALRDGTYRQLLVASEQFAFMRVDMRSGQQVIVVVNAAGESADVRLDTAALSTPHCRWHDCLNGGEFTVENGALTVPVYPSWLRILTAA